MKKAFTSVLALVLVFAAAPLLAQDRDMQVTAWISQTSIEGEDDFGDGFSTDFEDGRGAGLSVNRFLGRMFSVEGSAFYLRNDARLLDGDTPIDLGAVKLTAFSLGAQIHLAGRSRFDPYAGAGAAYIVASNLTSSDLVSGAVGSIELDDQVTYYINAGIGIQIAGGLAVVLDGRYLPFETDSRSTVTGVEQKIDLTTQLLSLGLRLRF